MYIPIDEMFLEAEVDLEWQRQEHQEKTVGVLCPVLITKEVKDIEDWWRSSLF